MCVTVYVCIRVYVFYYYYLVVTARYVFTYICPPSIAYVKSEPLTINQPWCSFAAVVYSFTGGDGHVFEEISWADNGQILHTTEWSARAARAA